MTKQNTTAIAEVCHGLILVVLFGSLVALLFLSEGCGSTAPVTLTRYSVEVEAAPVDVVPNVLIDLDTAAFGVLDLRTRLLWRAETVAVCQAINWGKVSGTVCIVCSRVDGGECEVSGYPSGMQEAFR